LLKIAINLWTVPDLWKRMTEARKLDQGIKTAADLMRVVIGICKDIANIIAVAVKTFAVAQAEKVAAGSTEKLYWKTIEETAEEFNYNKAALSPTQFLNASINILLIISGLIDLATAIENNDEHGVIAAGATVAMGTAGLAGVALDVTVAGQALITATIVLWWLAIDGALTLSELLEELRHDRRFEAVGHLVDQAGKVAAIGREMAAASDAANQPEQLAKDPELDQMIRTRLMSRAAARAEEVKTGISMMTNDVLENDLDRVGGYDDLVDNLGTEAKKELHADHSEEDPTLLSFACNRIFKGIDRMVRYAIRKDSPDRRSLGAAAKRGMEDRTE
jgi:hypothetical protein